MFDGMTKMRKVMVGADANKKLTLAGGKAGDPLPQAKQRS
jgi:hypothetical protein